MDNNNMPIGFIMAIARNNDALKHFANLDNTTINNISDYIKNSSTGDEAKEKINMSIDGLSKQNLDFLR